MNTNIDATSISFIDFLTKEDGGDYTKKYVSSKIEIPAFQRNYSWENKHVKDLLDSIDQNSEYYYIGNILVQKSPGADLIIDGQQRITTILLIIKALTELGISKKNFKKAKDIFYFNIEKEILRTSFSRKNLNFSFKSIINGDMLEESFLDENSKKFRNNFYYIKKYLLLIDDKNNFFEKVLNLTFVIITFKQGFDVNQLFEGLNSKGKILSPVQLTKNALIGSAKNDEGNKKIIDIWEEIESLYEKQRKIIWFDKFLRHLGFYKYGYVSNSKLFKKIKEDIKKQDDILQFSNVFKEDSILYFKLRTNRLLKNDIGKEIADTSWDIINAIIKNLSYSDLDQVYSVLFASVKYARDEKTYRESKNSLFLRDLKRVWAFSILAKYLDTKPSLFERDFATFSNNLFKKDYKKSRNLFIKLKSIIRNSDFEKFSTNLNNRIKITGKNEKKINSVNHRGFVSQILFCYLQDGNKFISEDCGIEHIIPKGDKNGLKKWKKIGKKYIKDIENITRYKLGNLTLLTGKDELSNESFDKKLKFYLKDEYKKNREIKKYKSDFNSIDPSNAVEKRGQDIGEELYKILEDLLNKEN